MEAILETFLSSPEFFLGCKKTTYTSWGSNERYCVELFPEGTWRILWTNTIGNKYNSPGIILVLPALDDDDYQECVVVNAMPEDDYFLSVFQNSEEELKEFMRAQLKEDA